MTDQTPTPPTVPSRPVSDASGLDWDSLVLRLEAMLNQLDKDRI